MKKILYFLICSTFLLCYSCSDDNNSITGEDDGEEEYLTYSVSVQLVYPDDSELEAVEGVKVTLTNTSNSTYDATTDAEGIAKFVVPVGVYEASATDNRSLGGYSFLYNGIKSNIVVTASWVETEIVKVDLKGSTTGQIVIKELYVGGCQKNDGSGDFHMDKYVILYNNSDQNATLDNLCLGMVLPYNAQGSNKDYVDGKLFYEAEGWIPAGTGIWYFPNSVTIESGKQMVIALNGAIDHTPTYSKSINFTNAEYYCTYDIEQYSNTSYYPSPSSVIPASHYLKAIHYGAGNAWALSNRSPAFYLFKTEGVTPVAFANDENNTNYHGGTVSAAQIRKKVPVEWILDGIEVFTTTSDSNQKRLTATIDGGQTYLENQIGYTSYRNVDKAATEAIADNKDKLVYSYNMGTEINGKPSTDPSGIDAEASIKNGARIIYQDTNNSTNDFHQRKQASLRD